MTNSGILYLCATPIGNLEDMTFRSIRILKEVDLIAAEDTRHTIKLLNHFDIHTEMTSYHEFNKIEKGEYLTNRLREGKSIALITDAGTPGISDPGEELVKMCISEGITVTSIPGPAAFVNAAVMSGLPCRRLAFEAFLPKDKKERERVLTELENETRTSIIYESPHHLKKTLRELYIRIGDRNTAIIRELTKVHEERISGTLSYLNDYYNEKDPRGEYVIVIEGRNKSDMEKEAREKWQDMSIDEHMKIYLDQGMDKKEAMKIVAKDRGVSKRDIYNSLL